MTSHLVSLRSHVPAALLALGSFVFVACGAPEERGPFAESTPRRVESGEQPPPIVSPSATTVAAADAATTTPAPDGGTTPVVDAGFDMHTWKPSAKGLWIWHWDYIGMTPAQAATKAKSIGVGYVLIKSGQDGSFWPQRFNASAVQEFTSRGIRVLAWPYITPAGGQAAIDAAVQAAQVPGVDGLVLDVEIEWEDVSNRVSAAKTLCEGIRNAVPGVWLGYTSFGWAGYHPGFPFSTFDTYCGDAAFPQVYFADRGVAWNGTKGLSEAVTHYQAANLKAPMWPIGSNDDVYNTSAGPETSALNGFFGAAGDYTSLWTFPDKTRPEKLTQLDSLDWAN